MLVEALVDAELDSGSVTFCLQWPYTQWYDQQVIDLLRLVASLKWNVFCDDTQKYGNYNNRPCA
jgi:hypothetical protein